jgi:hypothetical protein
LAANASNSFDTIEIDRASRKTKINTVVTTSFIFKVSNACNVHKGIINRHVPMAMMAPEAK